MSRFQTHSSWGKPPWEIDFRPPPRALPESADFAIIGGGFAGLAAAGWLRLHAPRSSVVLFEAAHIGSGASGRTGGMVLSETAAGDFSGLGNVLAGLRKILKKLGVESELALPGAWEIARSNGAETSDNGRALRGKSPIHWQDSGNLRVVSTVPGGTLDPGKQVNELARAAVQLGAIVAEDCDIQQIDWAGSPELKWSGGHMRVGGVLLATNALSLGLAGLKGRVHPKLTLAARTEPMKENQIAAIGLGARKPFYTIDFPYLWGRVCADNSIIWGAGLVDPPDSGDLDKIEISQGRPAEMFAKFRKRVCRLHPALAQVKFTHEWGGPIAFRDDYRPVFSRHPESEHGMVLGVFAGHGVALSVYLGAWAAEALLGRRRLPRWGKI
jgi:glycine/D-amino acid oxidase-like deaminating enzyme